jgi:hypothetical protein
MTKPHTKTRRAPKHHLDQRADAIIALARVRGFALENANFEIF